MIRKNYITACSPYVFNNIRSCIANNKIWISIDDITDIERRSIANAVVDILREDISRKRLLRSYKVLERASHSTITVPIVKVKYFIPKASVWLE